jgi:chorismate dehydratase
MRICLNDFLNARPLVWGFLKHPLPGVEVIRDLPAGCADRLRSGEADVALIPSIELLRIPGVRRVEGLGIAAESEVRSVLLVSKVSREKIRTLRLDPASRTSVVLARLILERRYGIAPEIVPHGADADLVIGDPAMGVGPKGRVVLDLAAEWKSLTGLPFVFAFWAAREEAWTEELPALLRGSFEASQSDFDAMVSSELPRLRDDLAAEITEEMVADYLRHCLHYELNARDEAGLSLFYRWAEEDGLAGG